jgi:hypothetical protein
MGPPTSSSLAEKKRLCSLLLSTAGARFPTLASGRKRLRPLDSSALLKIGRQFRRSISIKQPERTFCTGDARGRHLHWPGT